MLSQLLFAAAVVLAVLKLTGVVTLGWWPIIIIGFTLPLVGLSLLVICLIIAGIGIAVSR